MSVILLVLGLLVAGAGAGAIGFGILINELSLGPTLISAGTSALAGGLILVGLAAAVSELTRIAEALRGRPVSRPTRPAEAKQAEWPVAEPRPLEPRPVEPRAVESRPAEPRPVAASNVDVSASAIERLRSTMVRPDRIKPEVVAAAEEVPLSPGVPAPNGHNGQNGPAPEPKVATGVPPRPTSEAAVETLKEPRLDFLFRSRPARPAAPPPPAQPEPPLRPANPESFDSLWPRRPGREQVRQPMVEEEARPVEAEKSPPAAEEKRPPPEAASLAPAEEPRSVGILKSGVVDGMAYTLYADGSIEAQLPQGTVRFGSIAELRAHIENNS